MNTFDAVVTDIEGTTTSIAFVHDTLFPYAREHLPDFIGNHATRPDVRAALNQLKEAAETTSDDAAIQAALRFIDEDRKLGPLKALQGMIWENGYRTGAYVAHVYPDVPTALRAFKEQGKRCYVYSSGSVRAQKLLFAHTNEGDLTPFYDGYFDTSTGPKREVDSYRSIAQEIATDPERILFLSDVVAELDAAAEAGFRVIGVDRPGNPPRTASTHRFVTSFADVTRAQPDATPAP